jgi:hypothetical protein
MYSEPCNYFNSAENGQNDLPAGDIFRRQTPKWKWACRIWEQLDATGAFPVMEMVDA